MAINIKNREVEELLREIKLATGKGPSAVVLELVRKEAERLRREHNVEEKRRAIEEISKRYRSRIVGEPKPIDEIIGYDEDGLPT